MGLSTTLDIFWVYLDILLVQMTKVNLIEILPQKFGTSEALQKAEEIGRSRPWVFNELKRGVMKGKLFQQYRGIYHKKDG